MILQSLVEYYDRKAELGEIAPLGFEEKPIPFIIKIDKEGIFKDLVDTRELREKRLVPKNFLVPNAISRSGSNSWMTTFLLWDHTGFILGQAKGDSPKDRKKRHDLFATLSESEDFGELSSDRFLEQLTSPAINEILTIISRSESKPGKDLIKNLKALNKAVNDGEKQLGTFIASLDKLPESLQEKPALKAIKKFYDLEEYKKIFQHERWSDCAGIVNANLTFQLEGEMKIVVSDPDIINYQKELSSKPETEDETPSLCLVTGEKDYIERIHNSTPILGGQAMGKLVGFQKNSGFDSYGRQQSFNAPVGKKAQFAYTTALNTLIKSPKNHVNIGDTTIIFWSEKGHSLEDKIPFFLAKSKEDPDLNVQAVKQLYESIYSGKLNSEEEQRFYVLGLAPNAARVSIRYWMTGTVEEFAFHIKQHYDDLEIIRGKMDSEFFALNTLLSHTVLEYKLDNIAPNLAGQVTEAIMRNIPYPKSLHHSTIRRIRAEQHVSRVRAAILKACINRYNRFYNKTEEDISVALDINNMNPAYRLGRLFAVLENLQSRALNVETIRERYYGAFSSTPVTVFPQLMKLRNHHLAKLEGGQKYFFEKLIGEIIEGLDGSGNIPRQLTLDEQGRFAIGYYHQRQNIFKSKDEESDKEEDND